jgi:hypothetical protein
MNRRKVKKAAKRMVWKAVSARRWRAVSVRSWALGKRNLDASRKAA